MRNNPLVKKIIGGVLALVAVAAIGMGSASTANAQERVVVRERVVTRFVPGPVYRPRVFYPAPVVVVRGRYCHPYRCWR